MRCVGSFCGVCVCGDGDDGDDDDEADDDEVDEVDVWMQVGILVGGAL